MASTAESRKEIFARAYEALDPYQVAYLYNLGVKPTTVLVSDLARKTRPADYKSAVGVTKTDAILIQLLGWLDREGVDLSAFEFDESGKVTRFPVMSKK